ncbi:MAG: competence/damage-inducible protein A, partial [Sphingobacterium sp.]
MKAEIITIGDEILLGQVVDTNSTWIAQQLSSLQIHVKQITSITDTHNHILSSLKEASERADLIICTGGLGPTKDDVTKNVAAVYFNTTLVQDDSVLLHVEKIFQKINRNKSMPVSNISQAAVLACCEVLFNDWGTAPGMWVEKDGKIYVFLPGVPFEMKKLITHRVLPRLSQYVMTEKFVYRHLLVIGIGES